ncbi:MAG: PIN domain-containing protein [Balneolales bacterium]|nr:PIN domain-containing protein [Balneolales bacterium]
MTEKLTSDKHLFPDINILVDLLAKRSPHDVPALKLFSLAKAEKVKLYTTPLSITTCWYLLSKNAGADSAKKAIKAMLNFVQVITVDESCVRQAMDSRFKDFEDAVPYYAVVDDETIGCIITRNVRDFKESAIRIKTARKYISELQLSLRLNRTGNATASMLVFHRRILIPVT